MRFALGAAVVVALLLPAVRAIAQHTDHSGHDSTTKALPTLAGQDAYGAIAEIVAMLESDPSTDWAKVNIEGLRLHLIAMNEVTLNSIVRQSQVPDGARFDVTGAAPRTRASIREMVNAHAVQLNRMPGLRAVVAELPDGTRLTVTATSATDTALVARVRGLGFIGLMTLGAHHAAHHLAIARGEGHE
jgi:hypothetical protein